MNTNARSDFREGQHSNTRTLDTRTLENRLWLFGCQGQGGEGYGQDTGIAVAGLAGIREDKAQGEGTGPGPGIRRDGEGEFIGFRRQRLGADQGVIGIDLTGLVPVGHGPGPGDIEVTGFRDIRPEGQGDFRLLGPGEGALKGGKALRVEPAVVGIFSREADGTAGGQGVRIQEGQVGRSFILPEGEGGKIRGSDILVLPRVHQIPGTEDDDVIHGTTFQGDDRFRFRTVLQDPVEGLILGKEEVIVLRNRVQELQERFPAVVGDDEDASVHGIHSFIQPLHFRQGFRIRDPGYAADIPDEKGAAEKLQGQDRQNEKTGEEFPVLPVPEEKDSSQEDDQSGLAEPDPFR